MKKSIILKKGKNPGKTLAVFAGVHGNEKAGVFALNKAIQEITVNSGKVYFVYANPEAIKKNVRYVEKNLNRCFLKNNSDQTPEDLRARELMKILDKSDALLDLHASNVPGSTPFIICEKNAIDIAQKLDFNIVSFGWDDVEPGATDGYMYLQEKPALCCECGYVGESKEKSKLALKTIYQFLSYFGNIDRQTDFDCQKQIKIQAYFKALKITNSFKFSEKFKDFDKLKEGQLIATDGQKKYYAKKNDIIIFPNSLKKIGEEVFILGKIV